MKIRGVTIHMKNRVREHGDEVTIIKDSGAVVLLRHADGYMAWRKTTDYIMLTEASTRGT